MFYMKKRRKEKKEICKRTYLYLFKLYTDSGYNNIYYPAFLKHYDFEVSFNSRP